MKNLENLIKSIEDFAEDYIERQKEVSSEVTRKTKLNISAKSFTSQDVFNLMFKGHLSEHIKQYEILIPGFTQRVLNMIDSEITHQKSMAKKQGLSESVVTPVTVAIPVIEDFNIVWQQIREAMSYIVSSSPKKKPTQ